MAAQERQRPLIRYAGSAAKTSIGSKPIGSELGSEVYLKQYFCQACFGLAQSRADLPARRACAFVGKAVMSEWGEMTTDDTRPQIIVVSARKSGIKAPPGYSVVRVDRTTPLGNPFYMKDESERGKVCWQYEVYFLPALRHNRAMRKFFFALLDRARAGEKLALECWCAPRACHADTIKRYLDQAILKRQTRT